MSTSNEQIQSETAKSSNAGMPSPCSNIANNNNNNNNNTNASKNNNQVNTEQPKTKRQKIEKVKSNVKNASVSSSNSATTTTAATITTTTTTTISISSSTGSKKCVMVKRSPPPPDIIDTGERDLDVTVKLNEIGTKQLCSSLSSSAQSISSTPSSSNNSPSTSRATSLSQLINVQNNIADGISIVSCSVSTRNNNGNGSGIGNGSGDEVDRVTKASMVSVSVDILPNAHSSTVAKTQSKTPQQKTSSKPQAICNSIDAAIAAAAIEDMRQFEQSLSRQCLCGVSEDSLQKPFQSHYSLDVNGQKRIANLSEWPTNKLLQFLSNLQLLFDIYLKQNCKGFICARIMDVCDALIRNDRNLIDEIIVLGGYNNAYVQFLAGRVLASFLVIAKQELNDNWLKKLVDNLFFFERLDRIAVQKIHFSLEIIKRVVDWKDIDLHPLEDEIVDARTHINLPDVPTGIVSSDLLETQHAYMHFQAREPSLETNYFAVHYGSLGSTPENNSTPPPMVSNVHESSNLLSGSLGQMQQTFENFVSNVSNAPASYGLHGANMQAIHLSTTYNQQQGPSAAPMSSSTFLNSSHTTLDYIATMAASPFSMNNANHHNTPPTPSLAASAAATAGSCNIVTLTDSESFDTTALKCITIKILENKWPALVRNISTLIANHMNIANAENCVLNFLQLWENIISVKANLSIVETLPFYAQLDKFESLLLNQNLSCIVYKQMLCLFNEALCYGSTLALQDMLPEETCNLAHQIVRHVKDFRLLELLPRRQPENFVGLIGYKRSPVVYADNLLQHDHSIPSNSSSNSGDNGVGGGSGESGGGGGCTVIEMDKTILQKMVLLVLKSIAVTVKEIRSDSSDSSIDSTDYDAFQDMVLIERSIRNVLCKLETFIKGTLDFHPECHFSKILIHLFDDQDDHLIEAMVCTLDVTSGISFRNNAFPELVSMLNPVYTFLEFLKMISNSSDLLLDLLVSNETCFLLYLLRFLKYIRMNWTMFVQSCHDFGMGSNVLEEAMSVLIRLRLQISRLVSRQLYPYDISPVLRLLESCESLYEGNELS